MRYIVLVGSTLVHVSQYMLKGMSCSRLYHVLICVCLVLIGLEGNRVQRGSCRLVDLLKVSLLQVSLCELSCSVLC